MKNVKNKITSIAITILLIASIAGSLTLTPKVSALVNIPTEAYINVAPNPTGVGQAVTVNFWLAVPLPSSELAVNMTVFYTNPSGTTQQLGPFKSDVTGGTFTLFTPTSTGNYSFYMKYGGQQLTVPAFAQDYMEPSQSQTVQLTVQSEPVSSVPWIPLPTQYWETPVSSQNVQLWYNIIGPWLGLGLNSFANSGTYNNTGNFNPYTTGPATAHILWTKPWAFGGPIGGDAGGTEEASYWSTSQYEPKFAPVVINGFLYSTQYPGSTQNPAGIQCINLYNGQTVWTLNTTNPLRCGQVVNYVTPNQYGGIAYIWTTGPLPGVQNANGALELNMYDAMTGSYVLSVVNGSSTSASPMTLTVDNSGNLIGYYINSTAGTEIVHPAVGVNKLVNNTGPSLCAWNSTICINPGSQWTTPQNGVIAFSTGIMYAAPIPTTLNAAPISPALNGDGYFGSGTVIMTSGDVIVLQSGMNYPPAPSAGETTGWLIQAGFDCATGQNLWIFNRTETPYTRLEGYMAGSGVYIDINQATFLATAYYLTTGAQAWQITLTGPNGTAPNTYDEYAIINHAVVANGIDYVWGLGGDIWAIQMSSGKVLWQTNTETLIGSSGTETPYGVWPLWVFTVGAMAGQNNVLYVPVGHEYSVPLFHGAKMLAINATNGQLIWSDLGFDVTATEVSYGIMTTLNAYDNQIYAYGKGPSAITVTAPSIGVTTATKITLTGTLTDISAGASQSAVKANFPNGLPCVSDASQQGLMDYIYQQQPLPSNITGVPITISVLDSNNNYRTIGTTTSNALGSYGFTWTPDIPGDFTIYASFAGSDSYYPSSAATQFYAGIPASTPVPTAIVQSNLATTRDLMLYIVGAAVAIIIAIAIVGVLMLRKRP